MFSFSEDGDIGVEDAPEIPHSEIAQHADDHLDSVPSNPTHPSRRTLKHIERGFCTPDSKRSVGMSAVE